MLAWSCYAYTRGAGSCLACACGACPLHRACGSMTSPTLDRMLLFRLLLPRMIPWRMLMRRTTCAPCLALRKRASAASMSVLSHRARGEKSRKMHEQYSKDNARIVASVLLHLQKCTYCSIYRKRWNLQIHRCEHLSMSSSFFYCSFYCDFNRVYLQYLESLPPGPHAHAQLEEPEFGNGASAEDCRNRRLAHDMGRFTSPILYFFPSIGAYSPGESLRRPLTRRVGMNFWLCTTSV